MTLLKGPSYPAVLAPSLELTRSNVSNHLAGLRDCGIVVAEPEGRQTRYEIADPHLTRALTSSLGRRARGGRERVAPRPHMLGSRLLRGDRPVNAAVATERRATLHRRVRWIVGFTITYNVLEGITSPSRPAPRRPRSPLPASNRWSTARSASASPW